MKKRMILTLAILLVFTLLTGCRSGGTSPASAADAAKQQATAVPNAEGSDPAEPRSGEMPLTEIEKELGYGYLLPDESEYTGTIISKLERPEGEPPYISLEYTSDVFSGVVYATKKASDPNSSPDPALQWPELVDAGEQLVDGVNVHYLGYTPYGKVIAFWEKGGYAYTLRSELNVSPDLRALLPLFMENEHIDFDPVQTVNVEAAHPEEMTMEELKAVLGYDYKLPDESEYDGTIVCTLDRPEGEEGCIYLIYTPKGSQANVFITKRPEKETDAYDEWDGFAPAGSEVVNGIEVRFRDIFEIPGHRSIAFWKQNGFQYILNTMQDPELDIMSMLDLFMETE